jgi:hypothetical protein
MILLFIAGQSISPECGCYLLRPRTVPGGGVKANITAVQPVFDTPPQQDAQPGSDEGCLVLFTLAMSFSTVAPIRYFTVMRRSGIF